jgi:predicted lipase
MGTILKNIYQLAVFKTNFILQTVGHSLGGALASLLSTYVVDQRIYDGRRVTLVTLGQPRVGDQEYADYHDSLVLISCYTNYCLTGALLLPCCA